ncbi:hypothetical protein [Enterococcus alishanensis]|uniref:Uncharacterized protein n=1 Tax=Enterococcus alishanensis TaxID=1303817 RepID=A0ABS6TEA6_9ENTE|nr:hypothetical protein [Enterococcus alishanensis]MBV7391277.1 hypothetical protein [Enterococcus alishanensis]
MKTEQKFKRIKWNKQLISIMAGILLVVQLGLGSLPVLAETHQESTDETQVLENSLLAADEILEEANCVEKNR